MISVSNEYKRITQYQHTAVSLVQVVRDGVVIQILAAHSGQMDSDRYADVVRRFSCRFSDPTGVLTPQGIADLLAPYGTIVKLFRGLKIPRVERATDIDDSQAQWAEGTRVGTSAADDGSLVLGTI